MVTISQTNLYNTLAEKTILNGSSNPEMKYHSPKKVQFKEDGRFDFNPYSKNSMLSILSKYNLI